jgi:hypothetical protein
MPESSVSIETMSLTIASNAMLQDAVVTQLSTHKINTNPFVCFFQNVVVQLAPLPTEAARFALMFVAYSSATSSSKSPDTSSSSAVAS